MYGCTYVSIMYVCIYMYVCMYVRTYICMHVFMQARMYVRKSLYIYICIYIYIHLCMYGCTYVSIMYVCMYVWAANRMCIPNKDSHTPCMSQSVTPNAQTCSPVILALTSRRVIACFWSFIISTPRESNRIPLNVFRSIILWNSDMKSCAQT